MHLGDDWFSLGLLLLALSSVPLLPQTGGAIGTMTLAVMTRASLGHTGHPARGTINVLVSLAVVMRDR